MSQYSCNKDFHLLPASSPLFVCFALARIHILGFITPMARSLLLGFIDIMARIRAIGFKSSVARSRQMGFNKKLARITFLGFNLAVALSYQAAISSISPLK